MNLCKDKKQHPGYNSSTVLIQEYEGSRAGSTWLSVEWEIGGSYSGQGPIILTSMGREICDPSVKQPLKYSYSKALGQQQKCLHFTCP